MRAHDTGHEEFLEALAAGDVSADTPAARSRLAGCAECADAWGATRAISARIDRLAADVRSATAPTAGAARLESRVESMLEAARSVRAPAPRAQARRARRSWAWAAIAAAVLAVGLLWARPWQHGGERDDAHLGQADGIVVEAPSGALDARDGLRIVYDLPPDGKFSIVLAGTRAGGTAFRDVHETSASTWRPSAQILSELPASVRVQVLAVDGTGNLLASSQELSLPVSR